MAFVFSIGVWSVRVCFRARLCDGAGVGLDLMSKKATLFGRTVPFRVLVVKITQELYTTMRSFLVSLSGQRGRYYGIYGGALVLFTCCLVRGESDGLLAVDVAQLDVFVFVCRRAKKIVAIFLFCV